MGRKQGKWKKLLTGRVTAVSILLGLQLGVILAAVIKFARLYPLYRILSLIVGIALLLHVVRNTSSMAYRLAWIVLILLFPLFGAAVYLIFCGSRLSEDAGERRGRAAERQGVPVPENGEPDDRASRYLFAKTIASSRG